MKLEDVVDYIQTFGPRAEAAEAAQRKAEAGFATSEAALQRKLRQATDAAELEKSKVASAESQNKELRAEVAGLEKIVRDSEKLFTAAGEEHQKALRTRDSEWQDRLDDERKDAIEAQAKAVAQREREVRAELEVATQRIEAVRRGGEARLEAVEKAKDAEVERLEREIRQLQTDIGTERGKAQKVRKRSEAAESKLDAYRERAEEAEALLKAEKQAVQSIEQQRQSLLAEVSQLREAMFRAARAPA